MNATGALFFWRSKVLYGDRLCGSIRNEEDVSEQRLEQGL
jgi:hypothetical protein